MRLLIIADEDPRTRDHVMKVFGDKDYQIVAPDSVDLVLKDVLRKEAPVVLLGNVFDNMPAGDLIPILKKCNKNLTIILVSNEESLPLLRKLRREGIFYHALKPAREEDRDELLQAVRCAFANITGLSGPVGAAAKGHS
ncbi:MAG: response regulator [bacterium]|nr:response regulator [bacterium]MDT8395169.1 response regulator [bacterium]